MIQKLKIRDFCIKDKHIEEFMRIRQIEHLKFNIVLEDEEYVSAEYPDYENLFSFDKSWFKVHWGKRAVYIRTPSIFKDHVGKEVEVYQDQIFRKNYEAFRIRPIGFKLDYNNKTARKRVNINVPYFTSNGQCVLPKKYIYDNNLYKILTSRLSFNRIDYHSVKQGFIFARIAGGKDPGRLSYPLMECSNGVRTRKVHGVLDIVGESDKKIINFQFFKTVYDKNYGYDLIVFKEVKFDGI